MEPSYFTKVFVAILFFIGAPVFIFVSLRYFRKNAKNSYDPITGTTSPIHLAHEYEQAAKEGGDKLVSPIRFSTLMIFVLGGTFLLIWFLLGMENVKILIPGLLLLAFGLWGLFMLLLIKRVRDPQQRKRYQPLGLGLFLSILAIAYWLIFQQQGFDKASLTSMATLVLFIVAPTIFVSLRSRK
ncbi:MAG: hypothetical protein Q7R58_02905 [bacterium]|nr:hypothetical protein [bacterium]